MAPRETANNAYANKEHYGMLWYFLEQSILQFIPKMDVVSSV